MANITTLQANPLLSETDIVSTLSEKMPVLSPKGSEQLGRIVAFAKQNTTEELCFRNIPEDIALTLTSFSLEIKMNAAYLRKSLSFTKMVNLWGETAVLNVLVIILQTYNQNVAGKNPMSPSGLLECVKNLITYYPHEGISDVLLALKNATVAGHKFFQTFTAPQFFEIFQSHVENKSNIYQEDHLTNKRVDVKNEKPIVSDFLLRAWVYHDIKEDEILQSYIADIKKYRDLWKRSDESEKVLIEQNAKNIKSNLSDLLAKKVKQIKEVVSQMADYEKDGKESAERKAYWEKFDRMAVTHYTWVSKLFTIPKEYKAMLVIDYKKRLFEYIEKSQIEKQHPDYPAFAQKVKLGGVDLNNQFDFYVACQTKIFIFKKLIKENNLIEVIHSENLIEVLCRD